MQYTLDKAADFYINNTLKDREKAEFLELINKDYYGSFYGYKIIRDRKDLHTVERNILFKQVLKTSSYCFKLMDECYSRLSKEEKEALVDVIIKTSPKFAADLIEKRLVTTKQMITMIKVIKEETDFTPLINSISLNYKLVKSEARVKMFEMIMDSPDQLLILAKQKTFSILELREIYNKHNEYYYMDCKSGLQKMFSYCLTFRAFISSKEKLTLVERIRGKKDYELAEKIAGEDNLWKLPQDAIDIINSMLLAKKLIAQ